MLSSSKCLILLVLLSICNAQNNPTISMFSSFPTFPAFPTYPTSAFFSPNPSIYPSIYPSQSFTSSPSEYFIPSQNDQYLSIQFGPTTDIYSISNNFDVIQNVFQYLTKIDAAEWAMPYGSYNYQDFSTGIDYVYTDFIIQNNNNTHNKLLSLKEWLDFDKEQFIILFNTHQNITDIDLYIAGINDGYICCIEHEQGTTLRQQHYLNDDLDVTGHGALYSIDNMYSNVRLFCNNTWEWDETQIACKTMGYSFGIYLNNAASFINVPFGINWDMYYGDVDCNGDEETIWDCSMTADASNYISECQNFNSLVAVYCMRFYPVGENIVRAFKSHDSYDDFLPLVYKEDMDDLVMLCDDNNAYDRVALADYFCDMFAIYPGKNMSAVNSADEYYVDDNSISSVDITSYDENSWTIEFGDNVINSCSKQSVVQCDTNTGCRGHDDDCGADIDCCQKSSNHLLCHPEHGTCVDIRQMTKEDGYSPCYSQSECASGNCFDPGLSGICTGSESGSDFCFGSGHECFDDKQCCDSYYCEYGYCSQDLFNGNAPFFTSLNSYYMDWVEQVFEIYGYNLRNQMLFKLSSDGNCDDDRSPTSNVPTIWHYGDRGMNQGSYVMFTVRMYSTSNFGSLLLCYAVNDYASYESTGIYINVPKLIGNAESYGLITATVNWLQGSNIFHENSTLEYIEYELVLSRTLKDSEYIELDRLDSDWDNLMYPQQSWFYHQEKHRSEAIQFVFDEDISDTLVPSKGYRDSSNSDTPINVRIYWNNDGYPEIMDRIFYVIHAFHGYLENWQYVDSFKLTDIEFTLIDDDPKIQSSSLRFEGDSTAQGTDHLTGLQSGDEALLFTCYGCGTDANTDLIRIDYGPANDREFYSGNDVYITNTMDINTNEVTASYISFVTSYVPYIDAPLTNLLFKISVSSRFNHSLYKILTPGFNFSYPSDIDTTKPIITKIEGEGCMNIGKRALNCPTDGKYNTSQARITLFGTNFPQTRQNTTVEVRIDGIECQNILFSITENNDGLRNVSCEFGAGVSAYGTNGYSYVEMSYITNDGNNYEQKVSDPVRYFNYSHPTITQVVGCNQNISNLHTGNCSRTGGGVNKLRIFGTNFGRTGARVFIGGQLAIETLHDADNLHTLLWVQYGPGTRLHERIMVMNSRGGITTTNAYVSYKQCPAGYKQNGFKCIPCISGSYSNTLNAETCFLCDSGKYQPNNGSDTCLPCSTGSTASGLGNSDCTECAAGYYSPQEGGSECTECSEGQFNTKSGSSSCSTCNENSFSIRFERNRCLCDQAYYMYAEEIVVDDTNNSSSNSTRVLCRQCTEGMVCDQSGLNYSNIVAEENYYPMIHTTPETLAMVKCINTACVGGTKQCEDGFTGILCTDCESGLGKTSGHGCETCLPLATNVIRLLGVLICVSFIIIFFIRSTIKTAEAAKSDLSTIGKIGFSFLQFNSMALQFDYEFPSIVQQFLKVQQQPATVANGVLSVDCFVKDSNDQSISSLYVKSICYLILPILICVVCRIVFCKYMGMRETQHAVDKNIKRRRRSLKQLSRMELPEDSRARHYVNAWNYYITAVIITIFMIHPSIVEMTFALLNCKQLGALDDDYYLIQDMNIQCWKQTHLIFVLLVAMPMLICYVFGMPLFVLYRLYDNRDELTKEFNEINKNIVNRYHFLFKGYEPQFYYWEIIIMIRKILMVSIAVFFSYDIQIQALLATLLVVIALCVHSLACPYVTDAMDGLELLSLFGSFCTYFFGQFLFTESVGDAGKAIVSFIIVLVNLFVVIAVIFMVAGKGLNAVANFGKKFRALICCKNKKNNNNEADKDNDNEGYDNNNNNNSNNNNNEPRLKKQKSRQPQNTHSYQNANLVALQSESESPMKFHSPPKNNKIANSAVIEELPSNQNNSNIPGSPNDLPMSVKNDNEELSQYTYDSNIAKNIAD